MKSNHLRLIKLFGLIAGLASPFVQTKGPKVADCAQRYNECAKANWSKSHWTRLVFLLNEE